MVPLLEGFALVLLKGLQTALTWMTTASGTVVESEIVIILMRIMAAVELMITVARVEEAEILMVYYMFGYDVIKHTIMYLFLNISRKHTL